MSAPMGANGSVEIPLQGYVTLQDVCSHVGEIWKRARNERGLLFALDCSAVLDFSTLALTALGRLRKHLREFGCDLALVRPSPSVLERQDDSLLAPLLTAGAPAPAPLADTQPLPRKNRLPKKPPRDDKAPPTHQAPHHVRQLVKWYQRYWLN
jgi:anti-anti-sigma regulatory factor